MNKPWEKLYSKAMLTLDDGNWLKAVQYLKRSCELYPDKIDAHYELADIYLQMGHIDAAHEVVKAALATDPIDFQCNFILGNIYLAQGKVRDALKVYLYLEKMADEPIPDLLFNIAMAFDCKGDKRKALYYASFATDEDPSFIEAYELTGRLLLENGDLKGAHNAFMEILSLEPDNISAHHMLGVIYSKEKRWLEAIKEWEIVLSMVPDADETLRELGCAVNLLGDAEKAVKLLHKAIEINPENVHAKLDLRKLLHGKS
ncbi:MAG: tetratricopeptide repeat protein [Nitrospirae bacterium]|nr:tetratricopeptide repeat protein [Nitrospirota bacterium]